MKKYLCILPVALSFACGIAFAQVNDWHDFKSAQDHLHAAFDAMKRASAANFYDDGGHAARAEQLIRQADSELRKAYNSDSSQF